MIQTRELQLGNLVLKDGIIHEIGELNPSVLLILTLTDYDFRKALPERVDPIPLTEAWVVLRFGFEKESRKDRDGFQYYSIGTFSIVYKDGSFAFLDVIITEDERGYDYEKTDLPYVHSLQNLYFSLRRTELTILR
jgi:hypothetical protein